MLNQPTKILFTPLMSQISDVGLDGTKHFWKHQLIFLWIYKYLRDVFTVIDPNIKKAPRFLTEIIYFII